MLRRDHEVHSIFVRTIGYEVSGLRAVKHCYEDMYLYHVIGIVVSITCLRVPSGLI
jgi:hypothetical protein